MTRAGKLVALTAVVFGFAAASASAGQVETLALPSPLVDTSTPGGKIAKGTVPHVNVLLPDGYDADRPYPVLWLLHGANGGTDNWLPGVTKLLDGLGAIVVMPDGGRLGMYTNWWNGGQRGGPAWASYHLNVVRKEVERRYEIRSNRRWHAIGGISMGGQGTLRYAAMLPGYFGTAFGLSAAVPDMQSEAAQVGIAAAGGSSNVSYEQIFGPPSGTWAEGNSPQALVTNLGHTRIYLTSGNGTPCPQDPMTDTFALDVVTETFINEQQVPFANAARAEGADVTELTTCGVHTFGVWDRAFPGVRAWGLFKRVPKAPSEWTYRTIATKGEMWGLRFRFAEPPAEVIEFERSAQTLSGAGSGDVRIRGGRGCRMDLALPFEMRLPAACRE